MDEKKVFDENELTQPEIEESELEINDSNDSNNIEESDLNPNNWEIQNSQETPDLLRNISSVEETLVQIPTPTPKKRRGRRFFKITAMMLALIFSFGIFFGGGYLTAIYLGDTLATDLLGLSPSSVENSSSEKIVVNQITPVAATSDSINTAPVIIAETVGPSVVTIVSTIESNRSDRFSLIPAEGTGSGVIFDIDDEHLYIVTNQHVISDATKVEVNLITGDTFEAEILGYDSKMDIAVLALRIDEIDADIISKISVASFGNSDLLKVGELAVAIGSPLGKEFSNSVTTGVISAIDRTITVEGTELTLIQTDAAINPGNSGGALVNTVGEIIGINTAKFIDSDVEGMGFAIPINTALPIIQQILEKKDGSDLASALTEGRPFLGVGIQDVAGSSSDQSVIAFGVYINEIFVGSGAEEAGLKVGDIIIAINDVNVFNSTDLVNNISQFKIGDQIEITVIRNDQIITKKATLYAYKDVVN